MKRLAGLALLIKLISMVAALGTSVVLARMLDTDGFGLYSLCISVAAISVVFLSGGLPTLTVREYAKTAYSDNRGKVAQFRSFSYLWMLALGVLVAAVLYVVFHYTTLISTEINGIFVQVITLIILNTVIIYFGSEIRAFDLTTASQIPNLLIRPVLFIVLLYAVGFFGFQIDLLSALQLYNLSMVVAVVVSILILCGIRAHPFMIKFVALGQYKAWAKVALPLMASSAFVVATQNLDTIMLGILSTNHEIALYKVSFQLAGLIIIGMNVVNLITIRNFSSFFDKMEMRRFEEIAKKSTLYCIILSVPFAIVFVFLGRPILSLLFGEEYGAASMILAVLAIAQLINASFGIVGAILNITGHERMTLKGVAIAFVINGVLNAVLIGPYGAQGAAISTLVATLTWNVLLYRAVRNKLDIETLPYLPYRQISKSGEE